MQKRYNTQNLIKFNKSNAKEYGKRGGLKSGKTKLRAKIKQTLYLRALLYMFLEDFKKQDHFSNADIQDIKDYSHQIKIYTNRINKLLKKYKLKYKESI